MLSKVVPANRRGFMFGVSSALGSLLGIGGAWYSRYMLETLPYPRPFAYSFLLCFVCQAISYAFVALNREPPRHAEGQAVSASEYWRRLPRVLQRNPNFSRYLVARVLIVMGSMATAFFMIYAKSRFHVPDAFAAELTIAALVSQAVFTPLLGIVSDRKGLKWLLELSTVAQLVAMLLVLVSPGQTWLYMVFVLVYAAAAGMMIIGLAMSMEFSVPEDVPTFSALESTISTVPTVLAPLLAGWLVDHGSLTAPSWPAQAVSGYEIMFVVAALFTIAGYVVLRWFVQEPRHQAPGVGVGGAE
jgi:predicted MFS family arabinose efflux permease